MKVTLQRPLISPSNKCCVVDSTLVSVLKTREEAVLKRMERLLHPLQTVHVNYINCCMQMLCLGKSHTSNLLQDCSWLCLWWKCFSVAVKWLQFNWTTVMSHCSNWANFSFALYCSDPLKVVTGKWHLFHPTWITNSFPLCLFIYRCFLGINPEASTESKRQRGHINQQVCTLIRKIIDFEWMTV